MADRWIALHEDGHTIAPVTVGANGIVAFTPYIAGDWTLRREPALREEVGDVYLSTYRETGGAWAQALDAVLAMVAEYIERMRAAAVGDERDGVWEEGYGDACHDFLSALRGPEAPRG